MNFISSIEQNGIQYKIHDETTNVCELLVNGVLTNSFIEALAAAHGSVEFKLLNDIKINEPVIVPVGADVTINLNGHIIAPAQELNYAGGMITVVHGASLTINGEGTIGGFAPDLMAPLQVTHKGYMDDTKPANLTINGGYIIGRTYCICGNGNRGRGNSHIVINGGVFDTFSHTGTVIFNPQENSSVVINGGRLIGAATGIEMRSGDLTVNGGYIESLNAPASVHANGNGTSAIGSAVAICQHTTKNPINAVINGGVMKGFHAFYEANPQKNDAEAIAKVQIIINDGSFIANNSSIPVFSEDKIGFIKGGSFSHPVEAAYRA